MLDVDAVGGRAAKVVMMNEREIAAIYRLGERLHQADYVCLRPAGPKCRQEVGREPHAGLPVGRIWIRNYHSGRFPLPTPASCILPSRISDLQTAPFRLLTTIFHSPIQESIDACKECV